MYSPGMTVSTGVFDDDDRRLDGLLTDVASPDAEPDLLTPCNASSFVRADLRTGTGLNGEKKLFSLCSPDLKAPLWLC